MNRPITSRRGCATALTLLLCAPLARAGSSLGQLGLAWEPAAGWLDDDRYGPQVPPSSGGGQKTFQDPFGEEPYNPVDHIVRHDLQGFLESWEFDEITFDFEDTIAPFNTSDEVDVDDIDRRRAGLLYRVGPTNGQFLARVFVEKMDDVFGDDVELFGGSIGAEGIARVTERREVTPLVDYSIIMSFQGGDGEDFIDELYYLEMAGHLGGGVEVNGIQITAGVAASALLGEFNTQGPARMAGLRGDTIEGSNVSGYARVGYRAAGFPLLVNAQIYFGQIEGFAGSFGVRF